MPTLALILIAAFTLTAAAVGLARRNLIHAALFLVLAWAGIAAFYLWAGAEFLAFAQALVYVGAISMVVLFAVLLTRRTPAPDAEAAPSTAANDRISTGLLVGGLVTGVLVFAVSSSALTPAGPATPRLTVRELGHRLMEAHPAALLVAGVILTVALIGAVVIAASETERGPEGEP